MSDQTPEDDPPKPDDPPEDEQGGTAPEPEDTEPEDTAPEEAAPTDDEPEDPADEELPDVEPVEPPRDEVEDFRGVDPGAWSASQPTPPPAPELPPEPPPLVLERPRPVPPEPRRRPGVLGRLVRRVVLILFLVGVVLPVGSTLIYRFVGPPVTILMIQRLFEGKGLDRRWVPLSRMSPSLPNAVIAAEDARYCSHYGFDFQAMEKAMANNKRRPGRIRGGSTISQQTAKNVFLWPQRSYVRKGLEAYYTVLIETIWGKRRIMEVYLNTVEWGPGVYGADAAARRYFGVGADRLTPAQSARLAAILPSPLKWKAAKPGPYVKKRSRRIGAASGTVRRDGLAACIR